MMGGQSRTVNVNGVYVSDTERVGLNGLEDLTNPVNDVPSPEVVLISTGGSITQTLTHIFDKPLESGSGLSESDVLTFYSNYANSILRVGLADSYYDVFPTAGHRVFPFELELGNDFVNGQYLPLGEVGTLNKRGPVVNRSALVLTAESLVMQDQVSTTSSTLRINLNEANGQTAMSFARWCSGAWSNSNGTSTADILLKLFSFVGDRTRTDLTADWCANLTFADDLEQIPSMYPTSGWFPYEVDPIPQVNQGQMANDSIIARFATMGDIAAALTDQSDVNPGWLPRYWGKPDLTVALPPNETGIAIVPVRRGMEQDLNDLMLWTSMFMAYPLYEFISPGNWIRHDGAVHNGYAGGVNQIKISGPTRRVLYVLVDEQKPRQNIEFNLLGNPFTTNGNGIYDGMNDFDISQGFEVLNGFIGDPLQGYRSCMSWWRELFGATEDYWSAMVLAMDAKLAYLPQPSATQSEVLQVHSQWAYMNNMNIAVDDWPFDYPAQLYRTFDIPEYRLSINTLTSAVGIRFPNLNGTRAQVYSVGTHSPVIMLSVAGRMVGYSNLVNREDMMESPYHLGLQLVHGNYILATCFDTYCQTVGVSENAMLYGRGLANGQNVAAFYEHAMARFANMVYSTVNNPQFEFRWPWTTNDNISYAYANGLLSNGWYQPVCRISQQFQEKFLAYNDLCPRNDYLKLGVRFSAQKVLNTVWDRLDSEALNQGSIATDKTLNSKMRSLHSIMHWDSGIGAGGAMPRIRDFELVSLDNSESYKVSFCWTHPTSGSQWRFKYNLTQLPLPDIIPLSSALPPLLTFWDQNGRQLTERIRGERNALLTGSPGHAKQLTFSDSFFPYGALLNDMYATDLTDFDSLLGRVEF